MRDEGEVVVEESRDIRVEARARMRARISANVTYSLKRK
jgi:hypothetical protein